MNKPNYSTMTTDELIDRVLMDADRNSVDSLEYQLATRLAEAVGLIESYEQGWM